LLAPALIVPLTLGLLCVLVSWPERLDVWRGLAAGVLLGALALVRPNALIFLPFVLVWGWWVTRRSLSRRRFPAAAGAFVLATAVVIAPVTVRNCMVSDDFVLISCNGEINLYIGNNELSDGYTPVIPGLRQMIGSDDWDWFRYPRIIGGVERQEGRLMSAGEVSECFARRALAYMRQEPLRVLGLMGKRALLFWGPAEISSNKVVHYDRQNSPTLRHLPGLPVALAVALMGVLLFGVESTTMPSDNKSRREARARNAGSALVLLFVVVYFASFLPFLVSARLRVPIIPSVILFAAYGLGRLGRFLAEGEIRKAVVWAVVSVGLYVLVSRPWIPYQPNLAKWHYDRGVAYASGGQFDRAAEEYHLSLRANPGSARAYDKLGDDLFGQARAHNNLGNVMFAQGKLDEAIAEYKTAVRCDPNFAEGHYNLGNAYRRQGRDESAVECFEEALRLQPDYADAHNNLANVLVALGQTEQAIEHYNAALRLRPNLAEAHYNLANALLSLGRVDQAIEHYRQALRLRPAYADAHYALGYVLQRQGRLAEATEHFREALRIDPRHEPARRALDSALKQQGEP
jgi:tetratricopeptide (TPR) repeat protein